ncbi:MAG: hypothetical protein FWG10_01405 [Eubacteriaceae bacterium]|nr:hypothetical protein [Eubacteriaceae bacterium]
MNQEDNSAKNEKPVASQAPWRPSPPPKTSYSGGACYGEFYEYIDGKTDEILRIMSIEMAKLERWAKKSGGAAKSLAGTISDGKGAINVSLGARGATLVTGSIDEAAAFKKTGISAVFFGVSQKEFEKQLSIARENLGGAFRP